MAYYYALEGTENIVDKNYDCFAQKLGGDNDPTVCLHVVNYAISRVISARRKKVIKKNQQEF